MDRLRAAHILRVRMHLGHQKRRLEPRVSGAIYGFRHNVAIFDVKKTWRSLRTLFYGFAEMAQLRSSFFLLAPNPNLPLRALIERMRTEYPFRHGQFSSLYMTGYADRKWIDGLFSNWKVTFAFAEHMRRLAEGGAESKRFARYRKYLAGVEGADLMTKVIPDFLLVLATDRGAAHEAANLDLPLVGMVDSNTDPTPFLYPVFGNDDSVESLSFMLELLKRGVEEGRKREHEAFAITLLRKVKAQLDPGAAQPDDSFAMNAGAEPVVAEPLVGAAPSSGRHAPPPGPPDWLNDADFGWAREYARSGGVTEINAVGRQREAATSAARMGAPVRVPLASAARRGGAHTAR